MRIVHLIICLTLGFLGVHRFIVGQKKAGFVFLILSGMGIYWITNPNTEERGLITILILGIFIIIDALTLLLKGRYIVFSSNSKPKNSETLASKDQPLEQTGKAEKKVKKTSKVIPEQQSIVFIAYEINAHAAQDLITRKPSRKSASKPFDPMKILDHVISSWSDINKVTSKENIKFETQVLYKTPLENGLTIGEVTSSVINNSFLMSLISNADSSADLLLREARFSELSENSEFEKKQFALSLAENTEQFEHLQIGIFGWFKIGGNKTDGILKKIADYFPQSNEGELHFIELTADGKIFPNFSNVKTQKFEGRLAGNHALTLSIEKYLLGIQRINDVTLAATGLEAIPGFTQTKTVPKKQTKSVAKNPPSLENSKEKDHRVSLVDIQRWLQSSQIEATIDSIGDLNVVLVPPEEVITDEPKKLYLIGSQTLASGSKSEDFESEIEVTTNEANYFQSDYLTGLDNNDKAFKLDFNFRCYESSDPVTLPVKVKKGPIDTRGIKLSNIKIAELTIIAEDNEYSLEGRIEGDNGFIYGLETFTEEPQPEQFPRTIKVTEHEKSAEIYEYLGEVKKGDTVYLQLTSYAQLDGEIELKFEGKSKVDEGIDSQMMKLSALCETINDKLVDKSIQEICKLFTGTSYYNTARMLSQDAAGFEEESTDLEVGIAIWPDEPSAVGLIIYVRTDLSDYTIDEGIAEELADSSSILLDEGIDNIEPDVKSDFENVYYGVRVLVNDQVAY